MDVVSLPIAMATNGGLPDPTRALRVLMTASLDAPLKEVFAGDPPAIQLSFVISLRHDVSAHTLPVRVPDSRACSVFM